MSDLQKLILGFTGTRGSEKVPKGLEKLIKDRASKVVHGGAKGFDTAIGQVAKKYGIPEQVIRPAYSKVPFTHPEFGQVSSMRAAPLARNHDIVNASDVMIGGWKNGSRGTTYTLNNALKKGKPTYYFDVEEEAPKLLKLLEAL